MVEDDNAIVPIVLTVRRNTLEQVRELRKLRYTRGDTRERVGCVVDDDRDGFSTLHQPRVHVRETRVVGTSPGAARHATPTAKLETDNENVSSNVHKRLPELLPFSERIEHTFGVLEGGLKP
jgi:hypothetical protein